MGGLMRFIFTDDYYRLPITYFFLCDTAPLRNFFSFAKLAIQLLWIIIFVLLKQSKDGYSANHGQNGIGQMECINKKSRFDF